MSSSTVPRPSFLSLPPPGRLQLNLREYISNYYLYRSFEKNWSTGSVIHVPVPRFAFGDIVAGEHYFEFRVDGNPNPVWSLCFSLCPAFDFPKPLTYSCQSSLFNGTSSYILWSTVPTELPNHIYSIVETLKLNHDTRDLGDSFWILDLFLKDFHRPTSPTLPTKSATSPLENYQ
jgi:DNA-binding XRE family transcriptional regulator